MNEAGQDGFYDDYARQLAKKTDELDPKAKKYRPLLLRCFETAFDYLAEIHDHYATNHLGNRIAGELEWTLYCGARDHFRGNADLEADNKYFGDDVSDYSTDQIRQIAVAIGKANFSHLDPQLKRFNKELVPILDRALDDLAKATKSMDDNQSRFFHHRLAVFITRFP